jgi:predicted RecA/RadA family phage recombinase
MLNKIQNGDKLHLTAAAVITGGSLVVVGGLVGVAVKDAAIGDVIAVELEGVFEVPKVTGSGKSFAVGDAVYVIVADKTVTPTATDNTLVGYAFTAASTTAETVQVRLKQ